MMMKKIALAAAIMLVSGTNAYAWKAWSDCVPDSFGPGGCDSFGPGGGQSFGPGGGLSFGPGGGQSFGPGGGQSFGPGGGKSFMRDRSRGLNTDTMRPYQKQYGADW